MPLFRLLAVVLSVSTLAFAAAGCGGGGTSYSGTKPETWSASVCGALNTWATSLKAGSQSLSTDLRNSKDLKSVKARFIVFLKDAERSTETMVNDVKAAGAPAVKDGKAIQSDLENGLTEARSSFQRAVADAQKLRTDDPQAFTTGVTGLGQQIQQELTTIGQDFNNLSSKYDASDLDKATSKQAACKPFTSSG